MRRLTLTSKPLLLGLLAASFVVGGLPGRACQYCRMAATDPEAARMAARMHAGGFPLDAVLGQFQPAAPSATLTFPPAPDRVATSAADLPVPARPTVAAKPVAVFLSKPVATVPAVQSAPVPTRWADAGLLGLLSLGGWFCWRTRRVSAPVG